MSLLPTIFAIKLHQLVSRNSKFAGEFIVARLIDTTRLVTGQYHRFSASFVGEIGDLQSYFIGETFAPVERREDFRRIFWIDRLLSNLKSLLPRSHNPVGRGGLFQIEESHE